MTVTHARRARLGVEGPLRGQPQRAGKRLRALRHVDRDEDDRSLRESIRGERALLRLLPEPVETAVPDGDRAIPRQALCSGGEHDLFRMLEIEGELSRRLVALSWVDLETAQDGLLEPGRTGRRARTERNRIAVEPTAQSADRGRIPERALRGRQMVEDDSESEEVAPRLVANVTHLLG